MSRQPGTREATASGPEPAASSQQDEPSGPSPSTQRPAPSYVRLFRFASGLEVVRVLDAAWVRSFVPREVLETFLWSFLADDGVVDLGLFALVRSGRPVRCWTLVPSWNREVPGEQISVHAVFPGEPVDETTAPIRWFSLASFASPRFVHGSCDQIGFRCADGGTITQTVDATDDELRLLLAEHERTLRPEPLFPDDRQIRVDLGFPPAWILPLPAFLEWARPNVDTDSDNADPTG